MATISSLFNIRLIVLLTNAAIKLSIVGRTLEKYLEYSDELRV